MKKNLAMSLFVLFCAVGIAAGVSACSEDDGGGDSSGCSNDNDCKGDRVCSNGACVGGSNNGGSNNGGSNNGGNNGAGNNGGGNNGGGNNGGQCNTSDPAGDSCDSADNCTVGCLCDNDNGVASGSCINGRCASAEDMCEDACSDDGGWANEFCFIGQDGGGNNGGGNNGGGNNGGGNNGGGNNGGGDDFGEVCQSNGECNRNVCLFNGDVDFGYCSAPCESFTDCPTFWDCEEVGNGSGTFCVQD